MHTKSVGDLNGDGLTDLIVAGTGGVLVWYEQPDWAKHVIASGGGGWSTDAEASDIDRDGDQDLVISDWYQKNRLVWFENPGEGIGDWHLHLIGEPRAHDIELADFDRDGDVDVVTRQQGTAGDKLEIWIQDKPDAWQRQTLDCPGGEGLTVADVDRDGDVDIAIGARWYETPADITKSSWTEHVYAVDWQHDACVVKTADINRDGREDIVLTPAERAGGTYRVAWYEAPQDPQHGRWLEHVIDAAVETVLHSLAVADLSGDGNPDVVTAAMHQGKDPDQVRVYINGDGGRRWTKHVVADTSSHAIRVLDADDDGDLDIFGANWSGSRQVDLWENSRDRVGNNGGRLSLNRWTYLEIDARRSGKAFGLAMADLTGDGWGDIVSGRYSYRNPGGNMTGRWPRSTFPLDADALLALDVDQDDRGDVIALDAAGKVYWLEAEDVAGVAWKAQRVGDVGKADHKISSQGYALGQLVTGGKPETIINVGSIYYFEIPKEPEETAWPRTTITQQAYPEGIGVGDFDHDGELDVCGTIDNKQVA
ncbi:MAG: FG-GAP repeat domain-containing protein [Planctomycetota bacterium]